MYDVICMPPCGPVTSRRYRLDGSSELIEETLDHLDGYKGSKPVRIGNGAADHVVRSRADLVRFGADLCTANARLCLSVCAIWLTPHSDIYGELLDAICPHCASESSRACADAAQIYIRSSAGRFRMRHGAVCPASTRL
jgi:hypothetical protein